MIGFEECIEPETAGELLPTLYRVVSAGGTSFFQFATGLVNAECVKSIEYPIGLETGEMAIRVKFKDDTSEDHDPWEMVVFRESGA